MYIIFAHVERQLAQTPLDSFCEEMEKQQTSNKQFVRSVVFRLHKFHPLRDYETSHFLGRPGINRLKTRIKIRSPRVLLRGQWLKKPRCFCLASAAPVRSLFIRAQRRPRTPDVATTTPPPTAGSGGVIVRIIGRRELPLITAIDPFRGSMRHL